MVYPIDLMQHVLHFLFSTYFFHNQVLKANPPKWPKWKKNIISVIVCRWNQYRTAIKKVFRVMSQPFKPPFYLGSLLLESTIKACRSMWFQKWDVLSIHISSKKRKVDKYMMTGLCSTETDYKIIKVDFPPSVISVYFH